MAMPPKPPPPPRKLPKSNAETAEPMILAAGDLEDVKVAAPRPGPGLTLVGTVLADRYQILERIAEGGMGTVYVAEHITIHRRLAIKVLSPDLGNSPDIAQRFLREAQAASMIQHEHIVDIIDFGYTEQGQAFLAMELLEGEDLATTLDRERRLPWPRLRRMVLQMCRALNAAHEKGVVHRDMKPDNCFRIKRGGNADFIKLLDFGIAKVMTEATTFRGKRPVAQATAAGTLLGTPEYMAPELARDGVPDARVDIYSLGVMIYELLTGVVPLRGETFMSTLALHLTQEPIPPRQRAPSADIPPAIEAVIMRALAKDPDARYQTIREMTEALVAADQRLRSTGLFLQAIPDTPEFSPPSRDETETETEAERAPTLNINLQSAGGVRRTTPQHTVDTRSHRTLPPPEQSGQMAISQPSAQIDPSRISGEQRPPMGETMDSIETLDRFRPNPYRWLSAVLGLLVIGLGITVWQFNGFDDTPPDTATPVPTVAQAPVTSPPINVSAKTDPLGKVNTDPSMGAMLSITEEERLEVTADLQRYIKKCAKSHGLKPSNQGRVTVNLRVKVGTGKISADIPSELAGHLMGTCINQAVNSIQFQPGRKAMRFIHTFGP